MKILVFEDEYKQIEGLLDYVNFKYFKNEIKFTNYRTSQDFKDLNEINEYDIIIVDIQLDFTSQKDGITLINEIRKVNKNKNIFIITGKRGNIKQELKDIGLGDIKIVDKPLDDEILSKVIKSFNI
jgi:DNA-binding response OmpR family regulator